MGIRRVPTSFFCYSYHRNNWEEPLHMILSTQWAFSKCSLHLPLPLFPIMFFLQGNESDSFFEDFMIQYFLDLLNHSHIFDYRILFIIQTLLCLEIRALGCYLCFWQPEITCRGLVGKRKIRSNLLLTTSWVRFWQSPSQIAGGGVYVPIRIWPMAQKHVYTITWTCPAAYVAGTPSLNPLSPSPIGREFKLLTDNSSSHTQNVGTPRLSHSFPSPDPILNLSLMRFYRNSWLENCKSLCSLPTPFSEAAIWHL